MLSEREKMQLEEHELYEDISNVEELRKQELLESYDKHSSSRRAGLIYMLIGLFFGFVSLFVYLNGSTFANQYHDIMDETSPNTPMAVDGAANILLTVILFTFIALGVLFFLFGFFSMFGKGHGKGIKATRDEFAPTFIPEGELTLSADEPLIGANKTKVKSIKNDGAKRHYTDKRKAQRILDPSITFEGLRKALTVSFARHGFDMSDEAAEQLLAAISFSRVIYLKGVEAKDRRDYFEALMESFQMQGHFASPRKTFERVLGAVSLLPEKKKSFLLAVDGLYARNAKAYFEGYDAVIDDASQDHVYPDGTLISMNLLILVFLDEADDGKGIAPELLVHNSYLKLPLPRLDSPYMGDPFTVRATTDEIRYLSGKEAAVHYLSESKLSCYDATYASAKKGGFVLPNDVENGFERIAATLLHYGMDEDRVSAFIIATCVLPYALSVFDPSEKKEEGSFGEALSREFISSAEQKEIKEFTSSYFVKELVTEENPFDDDDASEETPKAEEAPVEETPVEEAPVEGAPSGETASEEVPNEETPVDAVKEKKAKKMTLKEKLKARRKEKAKPLEEKSVDVPEAKEEALEGNNEEIVVAEDEIKVVED